MKKLSQQMLAVSLLVACALPGLAKEQIATANGWTIDKSHSSANFAIKHLMVSNVNGTFGKMTGNVQYDGKNLAKANVDAVIDVNSIDTNEPKRDEHLRSKDFFEVEKYPTITFKSKKITETKTGFQILGTLTIHGVAKDVTLNAEPISKPVTMQGKTHIGTSATTKIMRKDFGISAETPDAMLGDEVKITLDIDLVKGEDKPQG